MFLDIQLQFICRGRLPLSTPCPRLVFVSWRSEEFVLRVRVAWRLNLSSSVSHFLPLHVTVGKQGRVTHVYSAALASLPAQLILNIN